MAYQGSAAYQLDASRQTWEVPVSRPLTVVRGGSNSFSREATASPLAAFFRLGMALAVTFALVGVVRVSLTAATVSCLRDVSTARMVVSAERDTRTVLQVERSALSSADRIQRIATENYGMVYASDVDTISLAHQDVEAAEDVASYADEADLTDTLS